MVGERAVRATVVGTLSIAPPLLNKFVHFSRSLADLAGPRVPIRLLTNEVLAQMFRSHAEGLSVGQFASCRHTPGAQDDTRLESAF